MTKKPVGKGLKALIPDSAKAGEVGTENVQTNAEIGVAEENRPSSNPEPSSGSQAAVVREPDPFFIENLKKEREKRIRAIAAMNEIIKKYNND